MMVNMDVLDVLIRLGFLFAAWSISFLAIIVSIDFIKEWVARK